MIAAQLRKLLGPSSDLRRSGVSVMATSVIGLGLTFLLHIVLARLLTPAEYGEYLLLVAWAMLLVVPARLGFDDIILRFGSTYMHEGRTVEVAGLVTFTFLAASGASFLLGAVAWFLATILPSLIGGASGAVLLGATQLILPVALVGILASLLRAGGRVVESQNLSQIARPAVLLVLLAALWAAGVNLDPALAIWITVAALWLVIFPTLVVQWCRGMRPSRWTPSNRQQWLSLAIVLMPLAVTREALNQVDLVMLGAMDGSSSAAMFSVAMRLASLIPFGLVAMAVATASPIAVAYHRGDRAEMGVIARTTARWSFAVALIISAVLAVTGPWLLGWFGMEYEAAYPLLLVMLIGGLGNAFTGVAAYFLTMTGRQKIALRFFAAALLLDVVLNLVLIPRFGAMGAAISWSATTLVMNLLLAAWVRSHMGIHSFALGSPPSGGEG